AHIKVISNLQESRTQIVHFFDSMVSTLPSGIYLTDVQQSGKTTTINGKARSNGAISNYLRNLDRSDWFADPNLIIISTKDHKQGSGTTRQNTFTLTVQDSTPSQSEAKKDKNGTGRQS